MAKPAIEIIENRPVRDKAPVEIMQSEDGSYNRWRIVQNNMPVEDDCEMVRVLFADNTARAFYVPRDIPAVDFACFVSQHERGLVMRKWEFDR